MDEWCHGSYSKNNKKKHLDTVTRNHLFNKETLHTYLTQIESIINGQPLKVHSKVGDNF